MRSSHSQEILKECNQVTAICIYEHTYTHRHTHMHVQCSFIQHKAKHYAKWTELEHIIVNKTGQTQKGNHRVFFSYADSRLLS